MTTIEPLQTLPIGPTSPQPGNQASQCTRSTPANLVSTGYPDASGGFNGVLSKAGTQVFGNDPNHTISAGDSFDVSYYWIDAFNWVDGTDQIGVTLYVTDDDTLTGTRTDLATALSGVSTANTSYQVANHPALYTADGTYVGKKIFVEFHPETAGTSGFARVDDFQLVVTAATSDSILNITSGDYSFGDLYHNQATDSTQRTVSFENIGPGSPLTLDGISLNDDGGGIFSITAAPAPSTSIPVGGSFDVTITATGGGGFTEYTGELLIDCTPNSEDLTLPISAAIATAGDPFNLLANCKFNDGVSSWSGGVATAGLSSNNGARVRGSEDGGAVTAESLGQVFGISDSPDFDLTVSFAIPDFTTYTGFSPLASANDRSFHLLVLNDAGINPAAPVTDALHTGAIIDLFYFPAGNEDSTAEGFYLYNGVTGAFESLALGTLLPSTDLSGTGEPPATLNVYQLKISGRDFGSSSASYEISISQPNSTDVAQTVTGLTSFHGADPTSSLARAVVLTTNDDALLSATNASTSAALQPSFWVDEVCATLSIPLPLALGNVTQFPKALHLFPNATGSFTFELTNLGIGADLTGAMPIFSDPRFSLVSPSFPFAISPGESQEFVVQVDASAVSGASEMLAALSFDSNDAFIANPSIAFFAKTLASSSEVLVDYDDGVAGNGIHDSSVRNGGFEDGVVDQSFVDTPFWQARFTPEGDIVVLTLDSDPATGLLHGQASGFSGTGSRAHPTQFLSPQEWTIQEGDAIEVHIDVKAGANFTLPANVQVIVEVVDADGALVNDPNSISGSASRWINSVNNISDPDNYQTIIEVSGPVPAGSPWIGNFPVVRFIKNGTRDSFLNVDNAYVRAFIDLGDLEITACSIDAATNEVTLRWTDPGYPSYKIQGDADLDFSDAIDVPLDGSEDTTTYPGEIEFTFTDPTGGTKRFWRVSSN